MNKGKYIRTPQGDFLVRTTVGNTHFTYKNDENSFFKFGDNVTNATGLIVSATLINK